MVIDFRNFKERRLIRLSNVRNVLTHPLQMSFEKSREKCPRKTKKDLFPTRNSRKALRMSGMWETVQAKR